MKAILEGIAFRAAEVIAAMNELVPAEGPLSIDGGLSRNPYFTRFLAEVLERDVHVATNPELTGTGTAQLAALACGREVPASGGATVVSPQQARSALLTRFAEAVKVSRAWQG
jgi:glycerol kinase